MYVYCTTILDDDNKEWCDKFYIGASARNSVTDDWYLGSGKKLKEYIEKYGTSKLKKTILVECSSLDELIQEERSAIVSLFEDPLNINMRRASTLGSLTCDEATKHKISESNKKYTGELHSQYGVRQTEIWKQRRSEAQKGTLNHFYGKFHTPEAREKIADARRGTRASDSARANMSAAQKGKVRSPEHRKNISLSKLNKVPTKCTYCDVARKRWSKELRDEHFENCASKLNP